MITLEDKIIVVTGGSGLIGSAIVAQINELKGIAINADIHEDEEVNLKFHLDITNDLSIKSLIEKVIDKYQRIDGWVNSAYPRTEDWSNKLEDLSFDSWRKNVDWHMNGYFISSKMVLDIMKQQGNGSLVNLSSIYGMVGPDFTVYEGTAMTMPAAYSAIKAGIINMDRYLASYFGKNNIRVNTVSPGGIFNNQPEIFLQNYNKKVPLGRMGLPTDISKGVAFLLSDASSYITGHNLVIDGGWTAI